MTRRLFPAVSLLLSLLPVLPAAPAARPNVLILICDDLNRALGCFGNPVVQSPNIDRLAARGVRFNAYCQVPSCYPSRTSFLSGLYPSTTEALEWDLNARGGKLKDVTYLPQHFRAHGWTTARLDKIFHIGKDDPASWDVSEEPLKDETGKNRVVYTPSEIEALGIEAQILESGRLTKGRYSGEGGPYSVFGGSGDTLMDQRSAKRAIELLEQSAKQDKPFLLAVGFRRPHLPWLAPKDCFDRYPVASMPLPSRPPGFDPAQWPDETEHRRAFASYYAAVTHSDTQVGRVLEALDRLKLAENTIVLLFGDHGYCLGEDSRHFGKGTTDDRSSATCLIIAAPGVSVAGKASPRIVELIDIYPTLVSLCGLPLPPSGLQGRDLTPLLKDPEAAWDERAFTWWGRKDNEFKPATVRDRRYRYSVNPDGSPGALFDFQADPRGWTNLIGDTAAAEARARMAALLEQVPPVRTPGQ